MTRRSERGAVAIMMVAVVVVGLVLTAGAARLGGAVLGRARAAAAADAAALAAADALALGYGASQATDDARETAASNGARLLECLCVGDEAVVVVEVDVGGPGLLGVTARGRARAVVRPECALGLDGCP